MNFIPFGSGTEQYNFLVSALAATDRAATPWLVLMWHVPAYSSYTVHYKEADCFRSVIEPLLKAASVDFVINGHVHAYERTHPARPPAGPRLDSFRPYLRPPRALRQMYNYALDPSGPVYLVIGDGGNTEGCGRVCSPQNQMRDFPVGLP